MEFRDLRRQYQLHKKEIDGAVRQVLANADFIHGKQVALLEEALAEYAGVKHCITCANGTDALLLALMAWEVGPGDAVFVPDFTFFASGEVVPLTGATPVFVDIDADTYNLSPQSLEAAIRQVLEQTDLRPRAVVAVDLFGQPADFQELKRIAEQYHLLILEDGAQGFGGRIGEQRACSFGSIGTTSFFPAKPLGCYGDGGAVFTDHDGWAERIRSLCVHGKGADKYDNVRIGMNSRLDTIQAAILLEKLKFFDEEIQRCNEVAEKYTESLRDVVKAPLVKEGMTSSWAQYTVCFQRQEQREEAMRRLKEKGIPAAVYYRKPMHLQKAFEADRIVAADCRAAEGVCDRCLSLPMHPYLSAEEISCVVSGIVVCTTDKDQRDE